MELKNMKDLHITPRRLQFLERMGITTLEDLLRTYPFRYENVQTVPFEQWQTGDNVAFEGVISSSAQVIRLANNRTMTRFSVLSWNEEIQVTVFNRPWPSQYAHGKTISVYGIYHGKRDVTASKTSFKPIEQEQGLHPVYTLPKDMRQNDMEAVMKKALSHASEIGDRVPERLRQKYRLIPLADALRQIHFPQNTEELHQAIRALKYEEFLCFQCVMQKAGSNEGSKPPKVFDQSLVENFISSLPYALTEDQRKAVDDILSDLRSEKMMYRMVQGDVGCGKTAVASIVLKACELSGHQAALLAPTEILARQHYENLKKQNLSVVFLTSSLPAAQKKKVLRQLKEQEAAIAVGTHSLFSEQVEFASLGLVIADEQQRFGVRQRRALLEKGDRPDFLMMSATPIPRTYAHFLYGDIALSSIHSMPPGRKPVKTRFVASSSMGPILKEVLEGIRAGRQVYVVCPTIEDNPDTGIRAASQIYEGMKQTFQDSIKVGLLHGKLKPAQKEEVMNAFSRGEIQILVSTTVVEVGIDVPNATIMVIYDAHRFGLSTLHQLRGRAARGKVQGECYLLSSTRDPQARERLQKMEVMLDGFSVCAYDLRMRGPGDLLGTRQSGLPSFVLGDFQKDPAIMEVCLRDAREILEKKEDKVMLGYVQKAIENVSCFD